MLPPRRQRTPTLDDSDSVDQDAEWERTLRDAKAKLDRKEAELARTRVELAETAQEKAALEQRLSQVALSPAAPPAPPPAPPPPKVDVDTDDPKALRLRSRWGSIVVPIAWITAAAAGIGTPIAAAVQHVVQLQTEIAALRQVVVSLQKEFADMKQERRPPPPNR